MGGKGSKIGKPRTISKVIHIAISNAPFLSLGACLPDEQAINVVSSGQLNWTSSEDGLVVVVVASSSHAMILGEGLTNHYLSVTFFLSGDQLARTKL